MYHVECEDQTQERFRLWCSNTNRYVLVDVSKEKIRERMRELATENADAWTESIIDEALKAGTVPRRRRVSH